MLMLLMISYFCALLILMVYDVVKEEIASDTSGTIQETKRVFAVLFVMNYEVTC